LELLLTAFKEAPLDLTGEATLRRPARQIAPVTVVTKNTNAIPSLFVCSAFAGEFLI
jgi:hypothetical protein